MRYLCGLILSAMLGACVGSAPSSTPASEPSATPAAEPTAFSLGPTATPWIAPTPLPTSTPAPGFGLSEAVIIERINRNIGSEERKVHLQSETTLGDGTPRHIYGNGMPDTLEVIGRPEYPTRVVVVAEWPLELVRPPLTSLMITTAVVLLPTQLPEFVTWYNTSQGHASMTFRAGRRAERFIDPRGGVVIVTFEAPR